MKKLFALMLALCLMLTAFAALASDGDVVGTLTGDGDPGYQPMTAADESAAVFQINWTTTSELYGHLYNKYYWNPASMSFIAVTQYPVIEWENNNPLVATVEVINYSSRSVNVTSGIASQKGVTASVGYEDEDDFVNCAAVTLNGMDGDAAVEDFITSGAWEIKSSYFDKINFKIWLQDLPSFGSYDHAELGTIYVNVAFPDANPN